MTDCLSLLSLSVKPVVCPMDTKKPQPTKAEAKEVTQPDSRYLVGRASAIMFRTALPREHPYCLRTAAQACFAVTPFGIFTFRTNRVLCLFIGRSNC